MKETEMIDTLYPNTRFVNSCVYYGLSLNTSNLGGNDFVNFALGGAVEIPSYILTQLALHYGGRRWPLCTSMVIGGVALLVIPAVPERKIQNYESLMIQSRNPLIEGPTTYRE